MAKNGLPPVFSWTSCASGVSALQLAAKSIRDQLPKCFSGERRQLDLRDLSAGGLDGFELSHQRMGGSDFVVAIGADQHEVPHIRPGQQILEQIERRRIEPLQVVEEQRQWMFRSGKYADEAPKYELKAALCLLWRQLRNRWLVSDDVA